MRETLKVKFISALEKCRLNEDFNSKKEQKKISLLKNEHQSVQLLMRESSGVATRIISKVRVVSDLAGFITVRNVEQVYVPMAVGKGCGDGNYIATEPGLFPDLLTPLRYDNSAIIPPDQLRCLWIDIKPDEGAQGGVYPLKIELYSEDGGELYAEAAIDIEIIDAVLPETDRLYTQWFYVDCLADYYNVPVWSERHWQIIENFISSAAAGGINMILTPIFTVPLDTKVGGERPTAQLTVITVKNGEYIFGFDRLDRWIDMLLRHNIKKIEMSHLFTQWGAAHAPKIVANVNGKEQQIFGWQTDSCGEDYVKFLRAFLSALIPHLEQKGVKDMCCFHISDEPNVKHLDTYMKAKAGIADLLEGLSVIDALSDYNFYKTGAVSTPVPACDEIEPFIKGGVSPLWTYYCCVQSKEVPNRFVAMPSARNRIMGVLEYRYNVRGFLQWGFNFYYNRFSDTLINPFADNCGDYFVPAGDAFSVYPKADGTALDTIHFLVFKHSREDIRAFELLENLTSKEYVTDIINAGVGYDMTFKKYPTESDYILSLRERVNEEIKNHIEK
ncbi:MAG: DUF4091 domain-containing protein [Clostridia bacterium]|nr:DUF4091 domain-containing protein [Clostridia bacterium]